MRNAQSQNRMSEISMRLDRLKRLTETGLNPVATMLTPIRTPGKARRIAAAAYFLTIAIVCTIIGTTVTFPFLAPLLIFALSFLSFHILALWTYDAECGWRRVDYPWVLSATVAVITAIISMDSKFYSNEAEHLFRELTASISETQSVVNVWGTICEHYMPIVDKDFEEAAKQEKKGKPTVTTAYRDSINALRQLCKIEPISISLHNVDGRLHKSLGPAILRPAIDNPLNNIDQQDIDDLDQLKGSLEFWRQCFSANDSMGVYRITFNPDVTFAINRAIEIEASLSKEVPEVVAADNLRSPRTARDVSVTYLQLCYGAERLYDTLSNILRLNRYMRLEGGLSLFNWVTQTPWRLRWWYFAFLFFVGLRLGKVTAEIKQVRARSKPTGTSC